MHASFRQLQLFLALAEHGSVTAAANACHVTQPTVSMQLKELADSVGVPLYEQIGKRLYLTEAGETLAATARTMLDEWQSFGQRIDALRGLKRGRLRIAMASTAKYFAPRMLADFCAHYPDIDVAIEILNRDGVVGRLRENRDDFYIMSMLPEDIPLEKRSFVTNPLVVIAPENHPLAAKKKISVEQLKHERFILREKGSGTRLACDAHFAKLSFSPLVRLELGSNEAIKQAVAGGMGLSILSRHALAHHLEDDQIAILNVQHFPVHSNWFILYPKGKRLSPIAETFLGYIK